jgi:hypothetical protein
MRSLTAFNLQHWSGEYRGSCCGYPSAITHPSNVEAPPSAAQPYWYPDDHF